MGDEPTTRISCRRGCRWEQATTTTVLILERTTALGHSDDIPDRDYLIRPNMTISGWIGPEYTSTKMNVDLPILGQIHYVTLTTRYGARLRRKFRLARTTQLDAGRFSRQVSDGGGIIATSQVNTLTLLSPDAHQKVNLTIGVRYFTIRPSRPSPAPTITSTATWV